MAKENIDIIIDKAKKSFHNIRITGGVSREEIIFLENVVGNIPISYFYFLENYGTIGFFGIEIYGIVKNNASSEYPPNTIAMTQKDIINKKIPEHHIIISSTGYGPVFLLDCVKGCVIGWNYSGAQDDDLPTFVTFEKFLEEEVLSAIQEYEAEKNNS